MSYLYTESCPRSDTDCYLCWYFINHYQPCGQWLMWSTHILYPYRITQLLLQLYPPDLWLIHDQLVYYMYTCLVSNRPATNNLHVNTSEHRYKCTHYGYVLHCVVWLCGRGYSKCLIVSTYSWKILKLSIMQPLPSFGVKVRYKGYMCTQTLISVYRLMYLIACSCAI